MEFIRRTICTLVWTAQGPIFGICLENMLTANEARTSRLSRVLMWTLVLLISSALHAFAPFVLFQVLQFVFQFLSIGFLLWFCYQDRPLVRITALLLLYGIPMLLDFPFSYLGTQITGLPPSEYYAEMGPTYVILITSLQLTAIALQGIVCTLWCRFRKKYDTAHSPALLGGFALIGVCILTSGFYATNSTSYGSSGVYMTVVTCIFFIICAAVFVLLSQAEKNIIRRKLAEIQAVTKLEQAHYAAIEERREEMDQIRRDYNGIVTNVLELLQSGDAAEAEKMLNDLSGRIAATREYPFCAIPIINAILTEKQQQCQQYGIPFHADILLPDTLPIQDLDLCSAFSNLMDNAIRVCRRENNAGINLSCRMIQEYLVIKCVNPSKKALGGKPDNTGFGLKILKEIASRYQGDFFIDYHAGTVTAQLSLPVCRSKGGNNQ